MPKNLNYDGVGFNAEWVAGFKTEKLFQATPELKHLFPGKEPESRTAALQEVYSLCRQMIKPIPSISSEPKAGE